MLKAVLRGRCRRPRSAGRARPTNRVDRERHAAPQQMTAITVTDLAETTVSSTTRNVLTSVQPASTRAGRNRSAIQPIRPLQDDVAQHESRQPERAGLSRDAGTHGIDRQKAEGDVLAQAAGEGRQHGDRRRCHHGHISAVVGMPGSPALSSNRAAGAPPARRERSLTKGTGP